MSHTISISGMWGMGGTNRWTYAAPSSTITFLWQATNHQPKGNCHRYFERPETERGVERAVECRLSEREQGEQLLATFLAVAKVLS